MMACAMGVHLRSQRREVRVVDVLGVGELPTSIAATFSDGQLELEEVSYNMELLLECVSANVMLLHTQILVFFILSSRHGTSARALLN